MNTELTRPERVLLMQLARQALESGVCGRPLPPLDLERLPPRLRESGASFVTLSRHGGLRGCIGAIEPYQPLAEDVREHAIAAALKDYRFPRVTEEELPEIEIEISCLTRPKPMIYDCPEDLLTGLQPGVDGVILIDGMRRATFLPQVWDKIPDPVTFLSYLCQKMGADPLSWQVKHLQVLTYQVEMFEEAQVISDN